MVLYRYTVEFKLSRHTCLACMVAIYSDDNPLLECSKCREHIHFFCSSRIQPLKDSFPHPFTCHGCQSGQQRNCKHCSKADGMLMQYSITKHNKIDPSGKSTLFYCHPTCVAFQRGSAKQDDYSSDSYVCHGCKMSIGNLIPCSELNCMSEVYHAYCATKTEHTPDGSGCPSLALYLNPTSKRLYGRLHCSLHMDLLIRDYDKYLSCVPCIQELTAMAEARQTIGGGKIHKPNKKGKQ